MMPFPGFMAVWCFSPISQRAKIKDSQCLCAPLTHSPPEALFEPTSADLARKTEISRTFSNKFQKKLCKYLHQGELQCELSSCQIPRHPLGQRPHEWPALLPQHRLWRRELQEMSQQETRLQQFTCSYLLIFLVAAAPAK